MAIKKRKECKQPALLMVGLVAALSLAACGGSDEPVADALPQKPTTEQQPASAKWYQGGTLHQASALEWQKADRANKLATAADLIATLHNKGSFEPHIMKLINSVDDMRPMAEDLVAQLDQAFEPDPDPQKNRQLFTNQSVPSTSVMVMLLMGWIQTGQ